MMIATPVALAALVVQAGVWTEGPPLPHPVSNNAVALTHVDGRPMVLSLMGLGPTLVWDDIVSHAYAWRPGDGTWRELEPVPGPGRLAGTAQGIRGRVYLFGGYTVAADGSEVSVPDVDVYDPVHGEWISGAPMPVPADDAVSGVWRDSLVYVISGWHDTDNVTDVQIYDPALDAWRAATPIEGPPVFGHAGALAGNTIVYLDGVRTRKERPRFVMEASAWRGDIDPADPTHVTWTRLPTHPGPPLYRAAAGVVGSWVVFAGGTDNPYNYDGIGYDGRPSEPRRMVFGYDVATGLWRTFAPLGIASMDHRGLVVADGMLILVGGMEAGRQVSARVSVGRAARVLAEGG